MTRPERQLAHMLEKIALKETISHKTPGKRTKRWKKAAEKHKAAEPAK